MRRTRQIVAQPLLVINDARRKVAREAGDALGQENFGLPELDPARQARLVKLPLEIRQLCGDFDKEHGRVEGRRG